MPGLPERVSREPDRQTDCRHSGQEPVLQALALPEPDPRTGCRHLEPARREQELLRMGRRSLEPELPALEQVSREPVSLVPDHQTDYRHLEPEWRG